MALNDNELSNNGKPDQGTENVSRSNQDFQPPFKIGTEFLHMGQTQDAIPFLEHANSIKPEDLDCVLNLGGAYILDKKFRKAVALLEPFSERNPENAAIWINLGAAYLGNPVLAGDKQQRMAISAFKKALKIDPNAPSVAYNIGLIYRDRKEYKKAQHWFGKAIMHNPQDEHAKVLYDKMDELRKK